MLTPTMDSLQYTSMSEISAENLFEKIMRQDVLWWEKNGHVQDYECKLTKLGKLVQAIHDHFRKLEPEYCLRLFEENVSRLEASNETVRRNTGVDEPDNFQDEVCRMSTPVNESPHFRPGGGAGDEGSNKYRTFPLAIKQKRKRHLSGGEPQSSSLRTSRRPSMIQESLALGRSPQFRDLHSSMESLHSKGSESIAPYGGAIGVGNLNLYRAVSLCCNYPVLMRAQERNGVNDEESLRLFLPRKDENRSVAEHLDMHCQKIFGISKRKHRQYQSAHPARDSDQSKRENLEQSLRQQLTLLETDTNPYYQSRNFQSSVDYKKWQDHERQEISLLLENKVPVFRGRHRHESTPRNRCDEYRELLKRAMTYDAECDKNRIGRRGLIRSGNQSGSDSSTSHSGRRDKILSKWGRRLLGEYAARYRVSVTTQVCFYLEITEECLRDEILEFDIVVFKTLRRKLEVLYSLIEEGRPLCTSEMGSVITVTERLIQRIRELVITLLTKWLPTTEQLQDGLELASVSFRVLDTLKRNDSSEWPECLSKWFEAATIEKYHSCKRADLETIPEMVLASVTHAVNVMKLMQRRDFHNSHTNYEAVFSEYISNFPQAVSSGLYEAVMADVRFSAKALPWIKSAPPIRRVDSLDLSDIALAYKLAEFDNLVKIREIDASRQNQHERNFSWRMAYHQLAMHWIEILSCHMRKQVIRAIEVDHFNSPDFHNLQETVTVGSSDFWEGNSSFTSPIKKENIVDEENNISPARAGLEDLDEKRHSDNSPHHTENAANEYNQCRKNGEDENKKIEIDSENVLEQWPLASPDNPTPPCSSVSSKCSDGGDGEEGSTSKSESFHSCVPSTAEISGATPKLTSTTDSSDKTYSSVTSHSENFGSSSTVVSDGESSVLPEVVPVKNAPHRERDDGLPSCSQQMVENGGDILCNVSSSVIDVISVLTRFMHFTQTIIETVYSLPGVESHSDVEVSFPSIGGYSRCTEATILTEMRERFIQKAAEVLCCVVQQYANNLLNEDASCVSQDRAILIIGRKLFHQIMNGKFNKTISRQNSTIVDSYTNLPGHEENAWNEKRVCQMIIRLNNLLVLEHGLPLIWLTLKKMASSPYDHGSSGRSSMPSTFLPEPDAEQFPSIRQVFDCNQDGESSDETPQTSSSTNTVIYHGERSDKNNNDGQNPEEWAKVEEPAYENVQILSAGRRSGIDYQSSSDESEPVYENVDFTSGTWMGIDAPEEEDINDQMQLTKAALDYLKEGTEYHLDICARGTSGLIAIQASFWIGDFLYIVLDSPPESKNGSEEQDIKELCARLSSVLDMFMRWTHKEGIEELHRLLWTQIIRDVKYKISLLKDIDSGASKIHAKHIQKVFKMILDTWYRHPSQPNGGDLDWLAQPIRPSLTLLELYCMPTPSLVGMYNQCRTEGDVNPDRDFDPSVGLNCREIVILCMRELQDRKSFSGEMLHGSLLRILEERNQYSANTAGANATNFCREMLDARLIEFAFKKCIRERLPDIIPLGHAEIGRDSQKNRSESLSTGTSQQSSLVTEDSYSGESSESDIQRIFHCDPDYFYRFSQNRLLLSIIDDVRLATNTSAVEHNSFLLNMLRMRSQTDQDAKVFLLENGFMQRGMMRSCLSCFH